MNNDMYKNILQFKFMWWGVAGAITPWGVFPRAAEKKLRYLCILRTDRKMLNVFFVHIHDFNENNLTKICNIEDGKFELPHTFDTTIFYDIVLVKRKYVRLGRHCQYKASLPRLRMCRGVVCN